MKVNRVCLQCGSQFLANHWDVARNKAKYCSRQCVGEMLIRFQRDKKKSKKKI